VGWEYPEARRVRHSLEVQDRANFHLLLKAIRSRRERGPAPPADPGSGAILILTIAAATAVRSAASPSRGRALLGLVNLMTRTSSTD